MNRKGLIEHTIDKINQLPDQKIKEVSDFVEFLLGKIDDKIITEGIQQLEKNAKAFEFLNEDEDLYSTDDLKESFK